LFGCKGYRKNDYYPFGMTMPGRKFSAGSGYRFGFNGQERSTEIGNDSYTAEFWQYDARLGRRWNKDPITKVSESPYATFGNNPILLTDPNGADTINFTRKTTFDKRQYRPAAFSSGKMDNFPSKMIDAGNSGMSSSQGIDIVGAAGNDVFRIIDVHTHIDENGKETTLSSTTTTLNLNNEQTFYRSGGHNVKGFIDDRYALASMSPDYLLQYYANKSGDIGVKSALAYQKTLPFAAKLNAIANVAYMVSGAYGIFRAALSRSIVQAFPSGFVTSNVEGFYIRSASTLSNGTYSKTIQTLAYMGENGSGNMLKLVRSIETEARAAGAKNLEIHGIEIVNSKILSVSKAAAEKVGYTFEQVTTNSIKLTKQLK
jgi:RHS repeat-associated protein